MKYAKNILLLLVLQLVLFGISMVAYLFPETVTWMGSAAIQVGYNIYVVLIVVITALLFVHLFLQKNWGRSAMLLFITSLLYVAYLVLLAVSNDMIIKQSMLVMTIVLTVLTVTQVSVRRRAAARPMPSKPIVVEDMKEHGVVGSVNGNKVHKSTCMIVDRIQKADRAYFSSVENALKEGYTPCKVCRPHDA